MISQTAVDHEENLWDGGGVVLVALNVPGLWNKNQEVDSFSPKFIKQMRVKYQSITTGLYLTYIKVSTHLWYTSHIRSMSTNPCRVQVSVVWALIHRQRPASARPTFTLCLHAPGTWESIARCSSLFCGTLMWEGTLISMWIIGQDDRLSQNFKFMGNKFSTTLPKQPETLSFDMYVHIHIFWLHPYNFSLPRKRSRV